MMISLCLSKREFSSYFFFLPMLAVYRLSSIIHLQSSFYFFLRRPVLGLPTGSLYFDAFTIRPSSVRPTSTSLFPCWESNIIFGLISDPFFFLLLLLHLKDSAFILKTSPSFLSLCYVSCPSVSWNTSHPRFYLFTPTGSVCLSLILRHHCSIVCIAMVLNIFPISHIPHNSYILSFVLPL